MKVLVINAGSSSIKYQLIDMTDETLLAKGQCDRIGIDGGKDDATGKLIYTCSQMPFFSRPAGCGEWILLEADLLPMIKTAVEEANRRGLNFAAEIDNLLLTTNNLGWEMFAAYDGAFSIRELSLTGTIL